MKIKPVHYFILLILNLLYLTCSHVSSNILMGSNAIKCIHKC